MGSNDSDFMEETNIVLVGCTGSGKSATGNSILGKNVFKSKSWFGGVTNVCKRQATMLKDGRILRVIDTPGLFDSASKSQIIEKEIVRCIDMARDGIHAILLVVSLKARFSEEQVAAVETLKHLFGSRIVDYMIIAFTGGDGLEEDDETLDDRLAHSCPEPLKELLEKCGNRRVVFDNRTKDEGKKAEQLDQLLTLIGNTVVKNGGKPYNHDLFLQLKNEAAEREFAKSKQKMAYEEEQLKQRITIMVQEKLKEQHEETINKLKQNVERLEREVNEHVKERQDAKDDQIRKLREQLSKAQREAAADEGGSCVVL